MKVAPPVTDCIVREQHLGDVEPSRLESQLVGAHQERLTGCSSRLKTGDRLGSLGKPETLSSERDGPGGHEHDPPPRFDLRCNLGGDELVPTPVRAKRAAPDLHDDATAIAKRGPRLVTGHVCPSIASPLGSCNRPRASCREADDHRPHC